MLCDDTHLKLNITVPVPTVFAPAVAPITTAEVALALPAKPPAPPPAVQFPKVVAPPAVPLAPAPAPLPPAPTP